jgi:hypothetical protein
MPEYRNHIKSPAFIEATICDDNNSPIGTIRIKPSSILWKSKGKKKYKMVPLSSFIKWINSPLTKTKDVTQ